jgi:hypothetical protein
MGKRATASTSMPPANEAAGMVVAENLERAHELITTELPAELQNSALALLHAVTVKVAVAEHFDAFCAHAFSKPEWAALASPVIAEMFEHDEDKLAELARIPDLVIEMGSGQATVTCMVAARWAARGETHRLTRLAESISASHVSKNACAVEVMLALAATLAVTRFSKAEQLYNAALQLAGEEHQEVIADAQKWLAAGRVVCSTSQEERDFWDVRLRKPRTAWTWQSSAELRALDTLSERLTPHMEGAGLFKAVVPGCWWDLALKCARQQEKMGVMAKQMESAQAVVQTHVATELPLERQVAENSSPQFERMTKTGRERGLFFLGWVCGALAMAITVVVLPAEFVQRVLAGINHGKPAVASSADKEAWRKGNLQRIAADMAPFTGQHKAVKTGLWQDHEKLLSGQSPELPADSPQYMKFLVWLHLDPPEDEEMRKRVPRLLLGKMKADAFSLWEELIYPGSANAPDIRHVAKEAMDDKTFQWSDEDKKRLQAMASEGS